MNPTTICVPQPFAAALLDDLREPVDDDERDEREGITDPEQLAYEWEVDDWSERWMTELDGAGDRVLTVPLTGPAADLLHDELTGCVFEGLTGRLADGSTGERERVVGALAGWVAVMAQLDEQIGGITAAVS